VNSCCGGPRNFALRGSRAITGLHPRSTEATARAEQIAPIIRELQRNGYSMRGIAVELDKRKVETPRGGAWHPQLVKRIVGRLVEMGRGS
jgi:hypothetical protein